MQAIVLNELVHFNSENVQLFEDIKFSSGVCTLLFDAAKFGNTEFLIKLIRSYPNIIWKKDNETQSLFHMAVINRQESVLNLLVLIIVYFLSCHAHYFSSVFQILRIDKFQRMVF